MEINLSPVLGCIYRLTAPRTHLIAGISGLAGYHASVVYQTFGGSWVATAQSEGVMASFCFHSNVCDTGNYANNAMKYIVAPWWVPQFVNYSTPSVALASAMLVSFLLNLIVLPILGFERTPSQQRLDMQNRQLMEIREIVVQEDLVLNENHHQIIAIQTNLSEVAQRVVQMISVVTHVETILTRFLTNEPSSPASSSTADAPSHPSLLSQTNFIIVFFQQLKQLLMRLLARITKQEMNNS